MLSYEQQLIITSLVYLYVLLMQLWTLKNWVYRPRKVRVITMYRFSNRCKYIERCSVCPVFDEYIIIRCYLLELIFGYCNRTC